MPAIKATVATASWRALHERSSIGGLDVQAVRISRGVPRFWPAAEGFPYLEQLAPDGWMLGMGRDREGFEHAYRRKLDAVGLDAIRARLAAINSDLPLALACFERDRDDCHRGLLATWLAEHGFGPVPEIESAQLTLELEVA